MKNRGSLFTLLFCGAFFFASPFLNKKWNRTGIDAPITWDAAGYYLYLPCFFYDDLGEPKNIESIQKKYSPFNYGNDIARSESGKYVMKYPMGQAILYFPAFGIAHFWAKHSDYPADGFSRPYQIALTFWAVLFPCVGLWALRKVLLRYYADGAVALVLVTLCLATNYYNFVAFSGLMTHGFLFTLYAVFLLLTDSWYRKNSTPLLIATGLLCGLLALVRPVEIIAVLLFFLWRLDTFSERIKFWIERWRSLLMFTAGAVAVGSLQLIYWKIYAGHWLYWSYGNEDGFNFLQPNIIKGLFSYRKGWLVYTPVMLFSVIGFAFLYRLKRELFAACLSFFLINIYIVFSWKNWGYGGSFSQRAVIQSYAALAFPLAAFFQAAQAQKFAKWLLFPALIFFIALNLSMTWQANVPNGGMDGYHMGRVYFWRLFFNFHIQMNDRKLMDTDEEMPARYTAALQTIYFNDFESDTTITEKAFSGKHALLLSKTIQRTPPIIIPVEKRGAVWYRATVKVFAPEMETNVWRQAEFRISLLNEKKVVKFNFYRIYRIIHSGEWNTIFIDIKAAPTYDAIRVDFRNADGDKKLFIDDLKLEATAPANKSVSD